MKRLLTLVAFFATLQASAQQVNPVPDYVFRNQMSVGRGTVTDTAAYFSIGPRYGANKGFMPPIVGDTATFSSGKRNGLLIFSVQKNKFLYWDSVRVQWSDMAGSSGSYITGSGITGYLPQFSASTTLDTSALFTLGNRLGIGSSTFAYNSTNTANVELNGTAGGILGFKRNDSARGYLWHTGDNMELANTAAGSIFFNTNSATRGSISSAGVWRLHNLAGTGDRVVVASSNGTLSAASSATALVDTTTISTRAWRQKGLDSLAALEVSGSGTTNYVPKFTAGSTIGNSQIFDNGTNVGIGTTSPTSKLHVIGEIRAADATSVWKVVNSSGIAFTGTSTAHPLALITSDAERLRITSGGDVGIGTSSPSEKLDVSGFIRTTSGVKVTDGTIDFRLSWASGNVGFFGNISNHPIDFYTNAAQRMRIFANGRIGINTTTDAGYQLDVNGTGRFSGALRAQGTIQATNNNDNNSGDFTGMVIGSSTTGTARTASFIKNTSSPYDFTIRTQDNTATTTGSMIFQNGSTETMRITASGNVGIGTASPLYKMHVLNQAGESSLFLESGTTTQAALYLANANNAIFNDNSTTNNLKFFVNSATRMTINSSGNVGIGTTSPAQKLDVAGNMQITGGGNWLRYDAYGYFGSGSVAGGTTTDVAVRSENSIYFSTGGATEKMRLSTTGELIIGGASDAGDYKLQVSGNIYNTGSAVLATNGTSHIGMGVVPSAWSWPNGVTQFRFGGHIAVADNSFLQLGTNSFYDGSNYVRVNAGYSSRYLQNDGGHFWSTAITSTAGSTVTFNEQMRMTRDGELLINTTTDAGDYKLQVAGNIYTTGNIQMTGSAAIRNTVSQFIDYGTGGSGDLYIRGGSGFANVMTATNAGEVLFNTTSDAGDYKLQVAGNIYGSSGANLAMTSGNVGVGLVPAGQSGFKTIEIGGTGVSGLIDVYQGTNRQLRIYNSSIDSYLANNANGGWMIFRTTTSGGTQSNALSITDASELLVNTSTDAGDYKLQVSGNALVTAGKLDITTNTGFGLSVSRSGTSVVAGQINNSNGILYYGAESSAGGGLFTGSSAYAAVIGSGAAYPLQFATDNVTRATINTNGELLINTLTDNGDFKLQVNGSALISGSIQTANPVSGTAVPWRLGSVVATNVQLDTGNYVEVNINGTFYRLAIVTPL